MVSGFQRKNIFEKTQIYTFHLYIMTYVILHIEFNNLGLASVLVSVPRIPVQKYIVVCLDVSSICEFIITF